MWVPHPAQIETLAPLLNGEVNTVFLQCGRKFGKTEIAAYALWRWCLLRPRSATYYIAPEASQGKEIIWRNNRLQRFGPSVYVRSVNQNEMCIYFKNESFIKIIGSENYSAADGWTPDLLVYDEFKSFRPQFHETMDPNRIVRNAPLLIIGTPPDMDATNRDQYISYATECKRSPNKKWVNYSSYDNPHIDRKMIDEKRAELERRGEIEVFEREYMGRLVAGGKKAIFPMLTPTDHVRDHKLVIDEIARDRSKLDWHITVDPGTTTCMAVLFVAINPFTKKMYILDELYETLQVNTSVHQILPRIKAKFAELYPNADFDVDVTKTFDEAAAWFQNEVQEQFGHFFQPTAKTANKKETGLSIIKDALIHKSIIISDRCKHLFEEMELYALDDNGRIPKKDDHLIDCLRYTMAAAYYNLNSVQEFVTVSENMRRGYSIDYDMRVDAAKDWTQNIGGSDYDIY
jgi:hypothetical protein